jgi:hypothetical protein
MIPSSSRLSKKRVLGVCFVGGMLGILLVYTMSQAPIVQAAHWVEHNGSGTQGASAARGQFVATSLLLPSLQGSVEGTLTNAGNIPTIVAELKRAFMLATWLQNWNEQRNPTPASPVSISPLPPLPSTVNVPVAIHLPVISRKGGVPMRGARVQLIPQLHAFPAASLVQASPPRIPVGTLNTVSVSINASTRLALAFYTTQSVTMVFQLPGGTVPQVAGNQPLLLASLPFVLANEQMYTNWLLHAWQDQDWLKDALNNPSWLIDRLREQGVTISPSLLAYLPTLDNLIFLQETSQVSLHITLSVHVHGAFAGTMLTIAAPQPETPVKTPCPPCPPCPKKA